MGWLGWLGFATESYHFCMIHRSMNQLFDPRNGSCQLGVMIGGI